MRSLTDEDIQRYRRVACERCGAAVGKPCTSLSSPGTTKRYPHPDRMIAFHEKEKS